MELIKFALIGFILGITTIIPGLSFATMAVAFGIYDRLINVIVLNIKKLLASWCFWLPLIIGGLAGVFFASNIITVLFLNYRIPTYWFFIGIITGSLPAVYLSVCRTASQRKFKLPSIPAAICIILTFALMVFMARFKPEEGTAIYTELTLALFGMLAVVGMLGAIAMIIPGISGAFVLLVTGFYLTILQSVKELNIPLLIPVFLGAGFGLLLGAAFVRFLLSKAPRVTYGAVFGLVAGSIVMLYPGGIGEGTGIIISAACLLAGFAVSFLMGRTKYR
ncbi:MAG: DUF368 domain-containing protein [Treponema sp.]|jgi:putative membrane protein|nr:DUF368 domain-containing protein [Treponema sp.]